MGRLRVISGDSINVTTVNGWTVTELPDGEKVAEVELDYISGTDFNWTAETIAYLRENLPVGVFTSILSCDCRVTDITPGATYLNAMLTAVKASFNVSQTDRVAVIPLEHTFGDANYPAPTKLHALWIVRGIFVE